MSEDNLIFKSFMHIGLGTLLSIFIGFITTPIITRLVPPEAYGRLSIFNLYISFSVMVMCLGLDQSLIRYYYKDNNLSFKSWIIKKSSLLPILLSLIVPICVLIIFNKIGFEFEFLDSMFPLLIGIFGSMLFRFAVLVLRLEGKSKDYARINVINKAFYAILSIVIMNITRNYDFVILAYTTAISVLIASIIAIYSSRELWFYCEKHATFQVSFKEMIKYGIPFILAIGLTTLFEAIDKLALKKYCDYGTVGIYAGAINIVNIFAIVQSTFNTMWAPVSIKHFEESPDDKLFYTNHNLNITFIMFFCGLSLIVFKDFFGLLLGKTYREAANILPFLTLHPIMYTISETTVTGIVVKQKSYLHIFIAAISCLANYFGNMLLVPLLGAKGAAISTGVSYIIFYILRTMFGMKYYRFNNNNNKFIIITIILVFNAIYSTFFNFGISTVILYLLSIALLLGLYSEVVKYLYKTIVSLFKSNR